MTIKARLGGPRGLLLLAAIPALAITGCQQQGTSAGGDDGSQEDCELPSSDIEFVVPYSAGGGFDTWARIIAPTLTENLPVDVNVPVVNREGAGGITGVTEVFGSPPDGTRIVITEPGILATAQISGTSDSDFSELRAVGQVTVEPEVIVVRGDSEWESIEDVQAAAAQNPILMGSGGLAAINIVSSDALGIPFEYVVHDGSSEALLSVVRGDTELALFPLGSVAEGIRAGDLKPLLLIGTPPADDHPDAETVDGVPTLDEVTGEDGLGAALEQHRIVVAPPETPDCVIAAYSDTFMASFEDTDFQAQVDEAGLQDAPMDAEATQEILQNTIDTLTEYADLLEETFQD